MTYPRAGSEALADIDLEVEAGQTLGIVGESGSGKTTLGRLLVGTLAPTRGRVLVNGREWSKVGPQRPAPGGRCRWCSRIRTVRSIPG